MKLPLLLFILASLCLIPGNLTSPLDTIPEVRRAADQCQDDPAWRTAVHNGEIGVPNESKVGDSCYFHFSQANLDESGAIDSYDNFYKNLTERDQKFGEFHEWKAAGDRIFQTPNFACGARHEGSCNFPTLRDLKEMYGPANRTIIRQAYFVSQMLEHLHEQNRQDQELVKDTCKLAAAYAPFIVKLAIPQPNASDTEACERLNKLIMSLIGSLVNEAFKRVKEGMKTFFTAFGGAFVADAVEKSLEPWIDAAKGQIQISNFGSQAPGTVAPLVFGSLLLKGYHDSKAERAHRHHNHVTTPISTQPFCHGLDVPDVNNVNIERLKLDFAEMTNDWLNNTRLGQDIMYRGNITQPSLTLMVMRNTNFTELIKQQDAGFDSRHKTVVENIVKQQIGEMGSQAHNFQTCVYGDKPCEVHKEDPKFKHNSYSDTIFCPYPKTDPYLKCSLGQLRFQDTGELKDVWIDGSSLRENIHQFGNDTGMVFDLEELQKEALMAYSVYGNRPVEVPLGDSGFLPIPKVQFRLPVCIMPQGITEDFTVEHDSHTHARNIPAMCGDWRGNETELFHERMGFQANSPLRNKVFRQDIVPNLFTNMHLSPASFFMGLCTNGYHWPASFGHDHIGNGTHEACEMVATATQNMTYEEGARWFCRDDPEIKKVRDSIDRVAQLPGPAHLPKPIPSLSSRCKDLLKMELGTLDEKWYKHYPDGKHYLELGPPEGWNVTDTWI
ncbi:hypothetical protein HYFRA_00012554 [Hymenoscyphus fraxineus]|uniref:Uncharacterized protein n=1 Tax=Hymenoscyphus fraxineus TaxID=746836 RepID=A0A9N9PZ01_9HELO|nr:hypothetical protein HYFRA_00012554 [Hymenoscyphus fraxineus]